MFTLLKDSLLCECSGKLTQPAQTNANSTLPVAGASESLSRMPPWDEGTVGLGWGGATLICDGLGARISPWTGSCPNLTLILDVETWVEFMYIKISAFEQRLDQ